MSFLEVIRECSEKDIRLSLRDDKLVISDTCGRLDATLTGQLKAHKGDIVAWLRPKDRRNGAIEARSREGAMPLSYAQRRLWFVDQLEGGSTQYNIPVSLRFDGVLDLDALRYAADALVQRHEVLRTTFTLVDGEPMQQPQAPGATALRCEDLSSLEPQKRDGALRALAQEELSRPFDLQRDLMLRLVVVTLAPKEFVLLLTLHHIAADGWSVNLLVREFSALYAARTEGRDAALAPVTLQYADFAAWQCEQFDQARLGEQMRFWHERLDDAPAVHSLPLDRPRPAEQDYAAGRTDTRLDGRLLGALKDLAAAHDTTLFTVLQTAFAAFVGRWSRTQDVTMGVPTAGRDRSELEGLVGFFINTLVVRTRWQAQDSFADLLSAQSQEMVDLFAHQDMPFDLLVEELNPQRSLAYNPLAQIKFVLQNYEESSLELTAADVRALDLTSDSIRFDLDLTCYEGADAMQLSWCYKRSLFDASTIDAMARSFRTWLTALVADPTRALGEQPLCDGEVRRALDGQSRGDQREVKASDHPLVAVYDVDRDPLAVAIRADDGSALTYGQLRERADRLAALLLEQGCEPGERIGIALDRTPSLLVAMLAVWRAGATYVPLDPANGQPRLRTMLQAAEIAQVIVEEHQLGALPLDDVEPLILESQVEAESWLGAYAQREGIALADCAPAEETAYVIFTSGSTGVPKGVMVSHGSLADYLGSAREAYYEQALGGALVVTSHCFDITVPSLFLPLLAGGAVHLLDAQESVPALAERLRDAALPAQLLRLTPNHLQALLWLMPRSPVDAAHVFVVGGEALAPDLVSEARQVFPQARFINHYGPTEATVGCVMLALDGELDAQRLSLPIGRPMANVTLAVLDDQDQPVPPGAAGQLYVAGPCLAQGYVNDRERTEAAFRTVTLGEEAIRMYATGDLVRWRDGELEFVGRVDHQVKLRGYRVEPGEVAYQLRQHARVTNAAVLLRQGEEEGDALIAYAAVGATLGASEAGALAQDLEQFIAGRLPPYMVPSHFVVLDALPLTAHGKLDRNALPGVQVRDSEAYEAPRPGTEQTLAAIWGELLGVERISAHDNFFASGGHSLLAMRLIGEVGKALSKSLAVREVFAHPTLRAMGQLLDGADAHGYARIPHAPRDQHLPLSFAQRRLWAIDELEGDSRQYNMPLALRLEGDFHREALGQALDALVERHEVLRTAIVKHGREAHQAIAEPMPVPVAFEDLSALGQDAQERDVVRRAEEEAATPFDLALPLKLRCTVLHLAPTHHVLLLTKHHIASDGWSAEILIRELTTLYECFRQGDENPLAPLPIQYADYASWQRDVLADEAIDSPLQYWTQTLADLPTVHGLPLDRPRPTRQAFAAARVMHQVDAATLTRLRALADAHDCTLFMLLETAFAVLLSRWSGEQDIAVGIPVAGREHADLEGLIGFFVNTLVLRTDLSDSPTFRSLLERNRTTVLDAYAHAEVPFERLVDALKPDRNAAFNPLVQIKFSLDVKAPGASAAPTDLALSNIDHGVEFIRFDLDLSATDTGDRVQLNWGYKRQLFDATTVEALADSFDVLLRAIAEAPDDAVDTLAVVDDQGVDALRRLGQGQTLRSTDEDHPLMAVVRHASEQPQAIAVSDGQGATLTYAELLAGADSVAGRLHARGVTVGDRIGVLLPRSAPLMVALVGTWRAGCSYVPLDPNGTAARLESIVADAQLTHVITDATLSQQLPAAGVSPLLLDAPSDAIADAPTPGVQPLGAAEAYTIFTSGSTGRPKGVMVSHGNLMDYLAHARRHFYAPHLTGAVVVTSHAFDITVPALYLPLLAGDTVELLPAQDEIVALAQRLDDGESGALLRMTPGHAEALRALGCDARDPGARHVFVIGGDRFTAALGEAMRDAFPHSRLINHYGPTEGTVGCACEDVTELATTQGQGSVPIGRPLSNVELRVTDGEGRWLPRGAPGELLIGGPGVALGYLGDTERSTQAFITHWAGSDALRCYRTGDRVRWGADGKLQFLGRVDHQIKLRGYRVEPAEIEHQLLADPAVASAVVVEREVSGTACLVAYLVPAPEPAGDWLARVTASVSRALPAYLVPAHFVVLDALPTGRNGKVNRAALPTPEVSTSEAYRAPRTELERTLARVWERVLKRERVGIDDDFFALGGDSIITIQIAALANQEGVRVSARQLFEYPTIAKLAGVCSHDVVVPATVEEVSGELPLLPAQLRFLNGDPVDQHHCNQSLLISPALTLSVAWLEAIAGALVRRHEALRLRWHRDDQGQWHAEHASVEEALGGAVVVVEPLHGAPGDLDAKLKARCAQWQGAFDLARGPMFRLVYFRVDDEARAHGARDRLLIVMHHLVVDGVSWRVLLQHLQEAIEQLRGGAQPTLASPSASLQQWGQALHRYAQSEALHGELPYWQGQMADPTSPLPMREGAPLHTKLASTRHHGFSLSAAQTTQLLQGCAVAYRTQTVELLVAAVHRALSQWSGHSTQRLELEAHGREEHVGEISVGNTLGWFTAHYPLTFRAEGDDLGQLIREVKEAYRAVPHRGLGYGVLRHIAGEQSLLPSSAQHAPAVLFNYLGQFGEGGGEQGDAGDDLRGPETSPNRRRSHALGIKAVVANGRLHVTLDYSEEQFEGQAVAALADVLGATLTQIIDHCAVPRAGALTPSDFPLAKVDGSQLDRWQQAYPELEDLYPATALQRGLLLHSMLGAGNYVMQTQMDLIGGVDAVALRAAWDWVVQRHEVFRTAFAAAGDTLHQLVLGKAVVPFQEEDWRDLASAEQERRFREYRHADKAQGFDAGCAPLMRVSLIRLADDRQRMLWTHHHALSDGWSTPIIYNDLMRAYKAFSDGRQPTAPTPARYRDYVRWLGQQPEAQARSYWESLLAQQTAPTALEIDRLPATGEAGYDEVCCTLSEAETVALRQLAQRHSTTVSTVLQLAWGWLLHRYSGEDQVSFGITTAGRPAEIADVEAMVGLFINTVPLVLDFADPALGSLPAQLQRTQEQVLDSMEHSYLPLSEIQRASPTPAGTDLFDSLLVFENYPLEVAVGSASARSKPGFRVEAQPAEVRTQYTLNVAAFLQQHLDLRIGFMREKVDPRAVSRMLEHLHAILRQLPTVAQVDELQLMGQEERSRLRAFNGTAQSFDAPTSVHECFAQWVARTPDALAVSANGEQLTYGELQAEAHRIALHLRARGVGRGDCVGLCLPRTVAMPAAMLAVLQLGAAYVPLDPAYPAARLAHMVSDSALALVLTAQSVLEEGTLPAEVPLLRLESMPPMADASFQAQTVDADEPAYVIYTSGSSGLPKGVVLTHRGAVNLACNQRELLAVTPGARVLGFASLSFDAATWEWLMALTNGASWHLCSQEERSSPSDLTEFLLREEITHATLPPSLLAYLPLERDYALQQLVVAGEACDPSMARRWASRYRLINAYGPTETTVCATLGAVPTQGPITIGKPLANVTAYVLDAEGREQPVGLPGELCVGGEGLAKAYRGQPQRTAERFVHSAEVGERVYRTGDLVRRLEDGSLQFHGRLDNQVQIRGHRVEPGEIEAQIAALEGVREAAVVVYEGSPDGHPSLAAYLVPEAPLPQAPAVATVRAALGEQLPAYMQPASINWLARLPMTANGKLDQAALPPPGPGAGELAMPPQTATERRLAAIWARVLRLTEDAISREATFFDLGGDSLLVVNQQSAITAEFAFEVPLQRLFERRSLTDLAALLDAYVLAAGDGEATGTSPHGDDNIVEEVF